MMGSATGKKHLSKVNLKMGFGERCIYADGRRQQTWTISGGQTICKNHGAEYDKERVGELDIATSVPESSGNTAKQP